MGAVLEQAIAAAYVAGGTQPKMNRLLVCGIWSF